MGVGWHGLLLTLFERQPIRGLSSARDLSHQITTNVLRAGKKRMKSM
jgi:hypothetical protein